MESERGCGWRQVGGVYLKGAGISQPCDALPFEVRPCGECGFDLKMSRSIQGVHAGYLAALLSGHTCAETWACPLCYFAETYPTMRGTMTKKEMKARGVPETVYFMFVSKRDYTPDSFIQEAMGQGISKRIPPNGLPKGFRLGDDWIYLVHNAVPFAPKLDISDPIGPLKPEIVFKRAVFYAFRPTAIEIILWSDTPQDKINEYRAAGYTPVLIDRNEENIKRHGERERKLPDVVQNYKQIAWARERKKAAKRNPKKGAFSQWQPRRIRRIEGDRP